MNLLYSWDNPNLFAICWIFLIVSVLTVGLCVVYFEEYLPYFIVQAYKFGKLQSPIHGETLKFTFSSLISLIEVPKSWFSHFYLVALASHLFLLVIRCFSSSLLSSFLIPVLKTSFGSSFVAEGTNLSSEPSASKFICLLLTIQFIRRVYETQFVSVNNPKARINFIQYGTGHAFYASLILLYYKGVFNASSDCCSPGWVKICASLLVFSWGSFVQYQAHYILACMRKDDGDIHGRNYDYMLPSGSLFDLVSCPHYFAEILIYSSIAALGGWSFEWTLLFLWVLVNQTLAAMMSHQWYQENFPHEMPPDRRAIVPYLF